MSDFERFKQHLRQQLGFLERSCAAYDEGHTDEAIRMATVLRVLLHHTKHSTSLLVHLAASSINLTDTCPPLSPKAVMYHGMGMHILGGGRSQFVPNLDKTPIAQPVNADHWWNQIVYVLDSSTRLSRRDIVLAAANKDGGAHVDANLTPDYQRLASDGAIGSYVLKVEGNEQRRPVTDVHLVCIRQMAHEILASPELRALAP